MIWRLWQSFLNLFREEQTEFCQCEHFQCYHLQGKWHCNMSIDAGKKCDCQRFIRPKNDGGGRGKVTAPEPGPKDREWLEKTIR